jgi:predicted HTH transcriptional regulator
MTAMVINLSDADLLARLKNFEDQFVERKTVSDGRDWLKTVVGFANSTPIDYPAVLYIGVRDDGTFESKECDFDGIQKKFNREMQNIYPRAAYFPKIITEGGNQALAVIVPGSPLRPHFAGPSFVRRGSQTFEASEVEFERLIATRSSKVYQISKYITRSVSYVNISVNHGQEMPSAPVDRVVVDCNEFWVTLSGQGVDKRSYILSDVELSFDHRQNRLQLEIKSRLL